jgi:AhpD family alkylhydroperoxidase
MDISRTAPAGFRAVRRLEQYVSENVDRRVLELVKLRASMVNECGYCVDMHSRDALAAGETHQRLFAVAAWRESPFFDERERAALAVTDALTRLGEHGVPDAVWEDVRAVWSEEETADLVLAVATINVWNRIVAATRLQPAAR